MSTVNRRIPLRFIALFMALLMVLSCAGCGGSQTNQIGSTPEPDPDPDPIDTVEFPDAIEQYNLALVLDTSGSVNDADPEHKALDAACMFLDSLFMAGTEGKNRQGVPKTAVGVVAYNDKAETVQVVSEVPSEASIVNLKKKIYSLDCPNGSGDKGLGDAIYKAADMLNTANPSSMPMPPTQTSAPPPLEPMRKNMIVLFTDGYTGTLPSGSAASAVTTPGQPFQPNQNFLPNFGSPVQERLTDGLNLAVNSQTEILW